MKTKLENVIKNRCKFLQYCMGPTKRTWSFPCVRNATVVANNTLLSNGKDRLIIYKNQKKV